MSRNQSRSALVVWLVVVGLFLFSAGASLASEPTPAQVVVQWMAWYPEYLDNAATLTTPSLRGGLSPRDWVHQHEGLLAQLGFEYVTVKVLAIEIQGREATVTVKARVFLVIGEVVQIERYSLKMLDGHWRIDGQEIKGDRVIGRTI